MPLIEELYVDTPRIGASDDVAKCISSMQAYGLQVAPVCDENGSYVGMLSLDDALIAPRKSSCSDILRPSAHVTVEATPSVALEVLATTGLPNVAVVAPDGRLAGCIGRDVTLRKMAHMTGGDEQGASISISMPAQDYEMGRAISIVEQTGAKVISATTNRNGHHVELLLTTNASNSTDMAEALLRHGIACKTYNGAGLSSNADVLKRNYEALMAYMKY